ncbi:hypothetical protein [Butyrivibrio sp. MB2005]|uniref:hypothetical protein n=1 Tax=Butyrivibrio sp. MB2005 TaxID=1280678 RepID=UPI0003FCDFF3|nr:hypothetical protein [Butyrivibrio sp. MB2005]
MNGYRNVDFMDKVPIDEVCKDSDAIVDAIEIFFKTGKGMDYSVKFWSNGDKSATDVIYEKLMEMN